MVRVFIENRRPNRRPNPKAKGSAVERKPLVGAFNTNANDLPVFSEAGVEAEEVEAEPEVEPEVVGRPLLPFAQLLRQVSSPSCHSPRSAPGSSSGPAAAATTTTSGRRSCSVCHSTRRQRQRQRQRQGRFASGTCISGSSRTGTSTAPYPCETASVPFDRTEGVTPSTRCWRIRASCDSRARFTLR